MTTSMRRCLARGALLLAACWPAAGPAQGSVSREQIRAALVFNFLKFTEWPPEAANAPLVLCLANPDRRTEAAFSQVQGRSIDNRPVQVRQAAGDLGACHLLYVHDSSTRELLERAALHPRVLTVGDQDDFTEAGGTIGLVEHNGRMQFRINMDTLRRGSYKISSQLLKLAVNVR